MKKVKKIIKSPKKKKVKFKNISSKKNFHFFDEPKSIEEIKEENEDKDDNANRSFDMEKDDIKTNKLVKSSQIKVNDNDIANIKINNIIKDKNNDIITTANNKIKNSLMRNQYGLCRD